MRILVCGGRDFDDYEAVCSILDGYNPSMLIQGGATGADALAARWAQEREVPYLTVPAKWKRDGKAAGPIRNRLMLKWKPDLVIAFPGGAGTRDMLDAAHEAHVTTMVIGRKM